MIAASASLTNEKLVFKGPIKAHIAFGFLFFLVAVFAGLLFGLQLQRLYPFPGVEIMSPGRIRMIHTNAVAYGFLINVFIAVLLWCVPRLTGRPVLSEKLTWVICVAWQVVVGLTAVGILFGQAQGIEWGETPTWVDPLAVVGVALLVVNVSTPILKNRGKRLYTSLWYFAAMLVWTPLVYIMGNFIPQYFVPGAGGAAITGMYIHDLVGLSVTPLGWGMMYYFVPVLLEKPIWSHTLSILGFWGLAFFYPLNGVHHFFYSPIPMYAQYGAVVSTIAVEMVVFTVIVNFFMTLRGRGDRLRTDLSVRWFFVGMVNYFITCLQCAFHTTLTFQRIIHFTDWVPGHAHLVMLGVFGFWLIGGIVYLWPKVTGNAWWSPKLNAWNFWLSSIGVTLMFIDLTCAGLVQGFMWANLAQWEKTLASSMPFWHFRTFAGGMIILGQCLQAYNMVMTSRSSVPRTASDPQRVAGPATAA
jgi:cytochrome c oxidase cbb3-type subunit 1